jgi:hypothetical protein
MSRHHRLFSIVVVVCAALATGTLAAAQEPGLSVDFQFAAAGKLMDAGTYAVTTTASGSVVLTPDKGTGTELTALRSVNRTVDRTELVFDKVGSVWFLSEVLVPGHGRKVVGKVDASEERKSVKGPKTK